MHGPAQLLDIAIEAALAAGNEILAVYGSGFAVAWKSDDSPVTLADERAHATIKAALEATGLPVLSEEGAMPAPAERQAWDRYWLVDPLDGTKEFVKRNGEFCVNIALMERDGLPSGPLGAAGPIAGVLYAPVPDLLYFAWQGGGAYRQRAAATSRGLPAYERAAMSERLPDAAMPARPYTVVASRSHTCPETTAYIHRMEQRHGEVALISMGSALKICLVAEGAADAYPRYTPTMEWDIAAGHAIVAEIGKQVIDMTTGAPLRYNKQELVNPWFIVQ